MYAIFERLCVCVLKNPDYFSHVTVPSIFSGKSSFLHKSIIRELAKQNYTKYDEKDTERERERECENKVHKYSQKMC